MLPRTARTTQQAVLPRHCDSWISGWPSTANAKPRSRFDRSPSLANSVLKQPGPSQSHRRSCCLQLAKSRHATRGETATSAGQPGVPRGGMAWFTGPGLGSAGSPIQLSPSEPLSPEPRACLSQKSDVSSPQAQARAWLSWPLAAARCAIQIVS